MSRSWAIPKYILWPAAIGVALRVYGKDVACRLILDNDRLKNDLLLTGLEAHMQRSAKDVCQVVVSSSAAAA